MARPSKVDRLPPSIKEAIGTLRASGRTIDEILDHLNSLDLGDDAPKRTGLATYIQRIDEIGEEMRREQAMAEALVAKFGEEPDDKVFRLNVNMMHGMLMKMNLAVRTGDVGDFSPQDMMFLSSTMKNLVAAAKNDADRIEKIEARAAAKAKREAADAAGTAMSERGMTRETIDAIKGRILGVKKG